MQDIDSMFEIAPAELAAIIRGTLTPAARSAPYVSTVSIDSRSLRKGAAFFALKGARSDGHTYVADAIANGAALAIVTHDFHATRSAMPDIPLIRVDDTLSALQSLSSWWRRNCLGKIIGITGSNGKTIVKECLYKILSSVAPAYQSPGSFNSQIGVPLSLIGMPKTSAFNLIEAGISQKGEMERLEQIVRPQFGILTNIGWAHISSFETQETIAREKSHLFKNIPDDGWLLVPESVEAGTSFFENIRCKVYKYGESSGSLPFVYKRETAPASTVLSIKFPGGEDISMTIESPSPHIVYGVELAVAAAFLLGIEPARIQRALYGYAPAPTRMEIWKSPTGVTVINDCADADLLSIQAALETLNELSRSNAPAPGDASGGKRFFVFGGMSDSGDYEEDFYGRVGQIAAKNGVDCLVVVGNGPIESTAAKFMESPTELSNRRVVRVDDYSGVKDNIVPLLSMGDAVLVKGPRLTGIETVSNDLIGAMAPNRFIVDLGAIQENVARIRRLVGPSTAILAMVKALAYGSDAVRLSTAMQGFGIDAFGVSSVDEGIQLRAAGITREILVMLCTPGETDKLARHRLTPVIYSFEILESIANSARKAGKVLNVHIKIDTGMGRTGALPEEALAMADAVSATGTLRVAGVMTHFACADDKNEDAFSIRQIDTFNDALNTLASHGYSNIVRHAAATAAALRFPCARLDMVRIGIGLYGIFPSEDVRECLDLALAVALVSRISRIQSHKRGDRIGYGGTYIVDRDDFRAAVVPMGYHDGAPRSISNVGYTLVNGRKAPIVGRISMDSMIVDVTSIPEASEGTEVLLHGNYNGYELRPEEVAASIDTIPYELLVRIGPRVQRVFIGT